MRKTTIFAITFMSFMIAYLCIGSVESEAGQESSIAKTSYINQTIETIWKLQKLICEEEDVIERIRKAVKFYKIGISTKEEETQFNQASLYVDHSLRIRDLGKLNLIINSLDVFNPREKEVAYYVLVTNPIFIGKPELALKYCNIFKEEFPDSPFLARIDTKIIEHTATRFKEINSSALPENEKLWLLGNLFYEAEAVDWNTVEVGYNNDYSTWIFDKLIKEYPESKWASNAEYKKLESYEAGAHEGGEWENNLDCISRYEDFLKKYPHSEFVPEVKIETGDHYYDLVDGPIREERHIEVSKAIEYLNKAKSAYTEVINSFPNTGYADRALKGKHRYGGVKGTDRLLQSLSSLISGVPPEISPKEGGSR